MGIRNVREAVADAQEPVGRPRYSGLVEVRVPVHRRADRSDRRSTSRSSLPHPADEPAGSSRGLEPSRIEHVAVAGPVKPEAVDVKTAGNIRSRSGGGSTSTVSPGSKLCSTFDAPPEGCTSAWTYRKGIGAREIAFLGSSCAGGSAPRAAEEDAGG